MNSSTSGSRKNVCEILPQRIKTLFVIPIFLSARSIAIEQTAIDAKLQIPADYRYLCGSILFPDEGFEYRK